MGKDFAGWSLLLHLLLFTCANNIADGARQMNEKLDVLRLVHSMDSSDHAKKANDDAPHLHLHQPTYFFTMEDFKAGNQMRVYLPPTDPSASPPILPREIAESIPFSSDDLPRILGFFSVSERSWAAGKFETTLKSCGAKPGNGETKFCATSLESMLDFVRRYLGSESQIDALVTRHLTQSETIVQNYTITKEPEEVAASKWLSCHKMIYPYAIFYCHGQTNSKALEVSLEGENGDRIEAAAACHFDTADWDANSPALKVLGAKPGSVVCHFFPEDDITFVSSLLA